MNFAKVLRTPFRTEHLRWLLLVTDNNLFWKSVKPLLSDKSRISDSIDISEKGEILKTGLETG